MRGRPFRAFCSQVQNTRGMMIHFSRQSSLTGFLLTLSLLFVGPVSAQDADLSDWAVASGHTLEIDSSGFELPTALAFVPDPGDAPSDPLYYVAELKGTIKVVLNDRTVEEFARVPTWGKQNASFDGRSQQGLAGLCLAPERGYLFATYTEPDAGGVLRNRIVRFTTAPGTFGTTPSEVDTEFGAVLAAFQASPAHQIGSCQVDGDTLLVGVGDGGNASSAFSTDVLLGKLLCFTLDGAPCPDHPFGDAGGGRDADPAAFVWAYGFRNPFGLELVGDDLFVAENGINTDRFLKPRRGEDHHWRGNDQSLALDAEFIFNPTVAPVQLQYLGDDTDYLDDALLPTFALAAFGGKGTPTGVIALDYDIDAGRVTRLPHYLLEYIGGGEQRVSSVAAGPDGLYTASMLPIGQQGGVVFRIAYQPERQHSVPVVERSSLVGRSGLGILDDKGCISCHLIADRGGGIGPTLDAFGINWRLTQRLNSRTYAEQVERVDALDEEPYRAYRDARRAVMAATGAERTWVWLRYYLQEPRFDNPEVQMPNLGLTPNEALALRAKLYRVNELRLPDARPGGLGGRLEQMLSSRQPGAIALVSLLALTGVVLASGALLAVRSLLGRRNRSEPV